MIASLIVNDTGCGAHCTLPLFLISRFSCIAAGVFQQVMWYLHTTRDVLFATTSLQRLRVHALFKNQNKGWSSLRAASDYQQLLCNAYTRAITAAERDSNLGRWAELLEFRITHLPYQKNPLLWMIRACSHIHQWSLATHVYGHIIYVVFHVHLFCLYIGRTKGALITRLRKQWTAARNGSEDSPFYSLLCRTGIQDWTIAPL